METEKLKGSTSINYVALIICVAIPLVIGFVSSMLTRNAQEAFGRMAKPPLAPPSWVFPVAWSILYIVMGIACYLIYMSTNPCKNAALMLYAIQLIMNFFWCIIFFRSGTYWLAAAWLLIMWLVILMLFLFVRHVSKGAFFLFIPLLVWCTFAMYLNVGVAILNK